MRVNVLKRTQSACITKSSRSIWTSTPFRGLSNITRMTFAWGSCPLARPKKRKKEKSETSFGADQVDSHFFFYTCFSAGP